MNSSLRSLQSQYRVDRREHPFRVLAVFLLGFGLVFLLGAGSAQAGVGGDDAGTCVNACGGYGAGNNGNACYCDAVCVATYGDCCADYQPVCNASDGLQPEQRAVATSFTWAGCAPRAGTRQIVEQASAIRPRST